MSVHRWQFDTRQPGESTRVRRALCEELGGSSIGTLRRFDVELVFSELVGNVTRHAPGTVEAVLEDSSEKLVLHVCDRGPGFMLGMPRLPEPTSETGRGLFLASAVADNLKIERRPHGGCHARAEFS